MARGRGKGGQEGQEAGTGAEQGERRQEELSHCWTLLSIVNLQGRRGGELGKEGGKEVGQDSHTQDTFVAGPYKGLSDFIIELHLMSLGKCGVPLE